ncbi:MAG: copper amine oxidase N-terminal domain-containing protein [Bacillota bacterium]|nr:copper amine oxidase N-terminal domain-containing protein [Bacillota bacterium]MDW7676563.1 copper amine oxidase N-terminal domain-containing protein [Bacillota bacterium]
MNKQNKRYLIMGLVLGIMLTLSLSPISAATDTISAFLRPGFQFFFDGEYAPLPEGQTVLVYEGRSYVPARFVAEQLGADVLWNEATRSIFITSPEPVVIEPEEPEVEEPEEEEPEEEETTQPSGNYRRLPVTQRLRDMEISIVEVMLPDEEYDPYYTRLSGTRIFIEMENTGSSPLQIVQAETKAIVDGVEYFAKDISAAYRDTTWYSDVRRDDVVDGYLVIPLIPEDSERMKLYVTILNNDYTQSTRVVELDVLLELD